jgi:hypothetical protein
MLDIVTPAQQGEKTDAQRLQRYDQTAGQAPKNETKKIGKDLREYPQGDSNEPRKTLDKCENRNATARQTAHFQGVLPPDLARIVAAWPALSGDTRRAILAMMEAAPNGSGNV